MAHFRSYSVVMAIMLAGLLMLLAGSARAITVSGTCLLEGSDDHSGTSVRMLAEYSGLESAYTTTAADGSFELTVVDGTYELWFVHPGYKTRINAPRFYWGDNLDTVTLPPRPLVEVTGEISGVAASQQYRVSGSLTVPPGETLLVQPGAEFFFEPGVEFHLDDGLLLALGSADQPIRFTATDPNAGWNGIYLDIDDGLADTVQFDHCDISHVRTRGLKIEHSGGDSSVVRIDHSRFHHNRNPGTSSGDGIWAYGRTTLHVTNTRFDHNSSQGLYLSWSSTSLIEDCVIEYNEANGISVALPSTQIDVRRTLFRANESMNGAAIYIAEDVQPDVQTIRDCRFEYNSAQNEGGAIRSELATVIEGCQFRGNSADVAGAVYLSGGAGTSQIRNCTFHNNTVNGGSAAVEGAQVDLDNCIFTGHTGPVVNLTTGEAVSHCDFFDNSDPLFGPAMPPELGEIVDENANGDLCDAWANIFLDPLYVSPSPVELRLSPDSPCIDAGTPLAPDDPDGTRADIGAYWFDQGGPPVTLTLNAGIENIPPNGGVVDYSAVVVSQLAQPQVVRAWTKVRLPNGAVIGPLDNFLYVVQPGVGLHVGLTLGVPDTAPPGEYEFRAFLGPNVNTPLVMGTFVFHKTALLAEGEGASERMEPVTAWRGTVRQR